MKWCQHCQVQEVLRARLSLLRGGLWSRMRREPQDELESSKEVEVSESGSGIVQQTVLHDIKQCSSSVAVEGGRAPPLWRRRWVLVVMAVSVLACAAVGAVALGTNARRQREVSPAATGGAISAGQLRPSSSPAVATFAPSGTVPPSRAKSPTPAGGTVPPSRAKSPTPAGRSKPLRLYRLPAEPLAVCNDGSSPVIRYSPGTEGYVVMLDGGGQCSDLRCLLQRPTSLRSTAADVDGATSFDSGGVLSRNPTESPVAHYSLVTVRYCSSDGWHGDRSGAYPEAELAAAGVKASEQYRYQHFRGARIVDAVFRLLTDPAREAERAKIGMPLLAPDMPVLFGGFSAGARGAMVNGDGVRARFNLTRLALWLDSGYYVDLGAGSHLREQTAAIFERYVNGSEAAAPRWNNVSRWQDLFGVYRMPAIASRYVVIASQLDSFQVGVNNIPGASQAVSRARVQTYVRDGLASLEPRSPCSSIISDTDESHAETAGDFKFNTIGVPRVSLRQEVQRVLDPSCNSLTRMIRPE